MCYLCPDPIPHKHDPLAQVSAWATRAYSALLFAWLPIGDLSGSELWALAAQVTPPCPACQDSEEILEISWDRQSPAKLVFVLQPQGHRALC